ncbi:hypothetical protein YB2330_001249 [Saitoella coloradoensis]
MPVHVVPEEVYFQVDRLAKEAPAARPGEMPSPTAIRHKMLEDLPHAAITGTSVRNRIQEVSSQNDSNAVGPNRSNLRRTGAHEEINLLIHAALDREPERRPNSTVILEELRKKFPDTTCSVNTILKRVKVILGTRKPELLGTTSRALPRKVHDEIARLIRDALRHEPKRRPNVESIREAVCQMFPDTSCSTNTVAKAINAFLSENNPRLLGIPNHGVPLDVRDELDRLVLAALVNKPGQKPSTTLVHQKLQEEFGSRTCSEGTVAKRITRLIGEQREGNVDNNRLTGQRMRTRRSSNKSSSRKKKHIQWTDDESLLSSEENGELEESEREPEDVDGDAKEQSKKDNDERDLTELSDVSEMLEEGGEYNIRERSVTIRESGGETVDDSMADDEDDEDDEVQFLPMPTNRPSKRKKTSAPESWSLPPLDPSIPAVRRTSLYVLRQYLPRDDPAAARQMEKEFNSMLDAQILQLGALKASRNPMDAASVGAPTPPATQDAGVTGDRDENRRLIELERENEALKEQVAALRNALRRS